MRILIRARDQAEWQLTTRAADDRQIGNYIHAAHWNQDFNIYPLQRSKTMNIEVIVQKPVKLEFFVDPSGSGVGGVD